MARSESEDLALVDVDPVEVNFRNLEAGSPKVIRLDAQSFLSPITPVPYDQVRMMILHRNLMNCSPVLLFESKRLLAL